MRSRERKTTGWTGGLAYQAGWHDGMARWQDGKMVRRQDDGRQEGKMRTRCQDGRISGRQARECWLLLIAVVGGVGSEQYESEMNKKRIL